MCRVLFWSFRFMVGIGFFFIAFFAFAFWLSAKRQFEKHRWFLRLAILALPLPWISSELGWVVAENGRQPWTIDGVLPTFLSVSSIPAGDVWLSLGGFVLFYSLLAVVELYLMIKYIRLGPEKALGAAALGTGGAGMNPLDLLRLRARCGVIWWVLLGVLLIGFAVTDGFDLGSRHPAAVRGAKRWRAPRRRQCHRPGLGRQPGLADPGRRRDLRRLAAGLCRRPFPASISR